MINNKNKVTSNVKLEYLNHLFKSLNNLNINYCVLRGYEDLPEIIPPLGAIWASRTPLGLILSTAFDSAL